MSFGSGPPSGQALERIRELAELVYHDDPEQLLFQIAEIAGEQCYLRHGVEVGPGDIVVDVGANVGVAAVHFAVQCSASRVYSFEPVAPIFAMLRRNVANIPACVADPRGMGPATGRVPITYYPDAAAMSGVYADRRRDRSLVRTALRNAGFDDAAAERRLVGFDRKQRLMAEMTTLSGFLAERSLERVDLLKIDVEQAELDVLAGLREADWPRIRQVAVEVHDECGRGQALRRDLQGRGFRVAMESDPALFGTSVTMLYAVRP